MQQVFPAWGWGAFAALLLVLLVIDLVAHRGGRAHSRKAAIGWSVVWIAAGLVFYGFVWVMFGSEPAQEYLAAYLIEKSLSVDNLFVFLIIFQSLNIKHEYQHTVLLWGIFGALVFRGIFVFLGAAALERWGFVAYVFGAILLWAAWRVFRHDPAAETENKAVVWLSRHLPVTHEIHGTHFVAHVNGRRVATPLLLAVAGLELTDIVFAIDSVPAAFSVTTEPFLVYSSNAFAILGLRSLYLVLAHTIAELKYLHYGLAGVLAFAGLKLIADHWVHVPPAVSIAIIVAIIGVAVWASVRARRLDVARGARPPAPRDPLEQR